MAGFAPAALVTASGAYGSFTVMANARGQLFHVRDGAEWTGSTPVPKFDLSPLLPALAPHGGSVARLALRDLSRKAFERVGLLAVVRQNGRVEVGSTLGGESLRDFALENAAQDVALVALDDDTTRLIVLSGDSLFSAKIHHGDRREPRVEPLTPMDPIPPSFSQAAGGFDFLSAISESHVVLASQTGFVYDSQTGLQRVSPWIESFLAVEHRNQTQIVWTEGRQVLRATLKAGALSDRETLFSADAGTLIRHIAYAISSRCELTPESPEGVLSCDDETHTARLLALSADGRLSSPWSRAPVAASWALGWSDTADEDRVSARLLEHPWIPVADRRWAVGRVTTGILFPYTRLAHLKQWAERRLDAHRISQDVKLASTLSEWGTREEQLLILELLSVGARRSLLQGGGNQELRDAEIAELRALLELPVERARADRLIEILGTHRGRFLDTLQSDFEYRAPRWAESHLKLKDALLLFLRRWDPTWPGLGAPSTVPQ